MCDRRVLPGPVRPNQSLLYVSRSRFAFAKERRVSGVRRAAPAAAAEQEGGGGFCVPFLCWLTARAAEGVVWHEQVKRCVMSAEHVLRTGGSGGGLRVDTG